MKKICKIVILGVILVLGACSVKAENQKNRREFLSQVKYQTLLYFNNTPPRAPFGTFNETGEKLLASGGLENSRSLDKFVFIDIESSSTNIGFYRRVNDNSEWKITIQKDNVLFSSGTKTYYTKIRGKQN